MASATTDKPLLTTPIDQGSKPGTDQRGGSIIDPCPSSGRDGPDHVTAASAVVSAFGSCDLFYQPSLFPGNSVPA
jgi:hypothetical protein